MRYFLYGNELNHLWRWRPCLCPFIIRLFRPANEWISPGVYGRKLSFGSFYGICISKDVSRQCPSGQIGFPPIIFRFRIWGMSFGLLGWTVLRIWSRTFAFCIIKWHVSFLFSTTWEPSSHTQAHYNAHFTLIMVLFNAKLRLFLGNRRKVRKRNL